MRVTAALLVETGHPLELADLELPALKPGQALVEVAFSGVCGSQVLEARGHRGVDRFLPHCLGHEGSGTVLEVGPGVTKVRGGDRVILSWLRGGGADVPGTEYRWAGRRISAGAITTFGTHSVICESRLTPLPDAVSLADAALLGCAVPTGLGSVFNTARARAGQSIAILGLGGIGLCAVAGAAIAGCTPVIAADITPFKLELAREMGANATIDAAATDIVGGIGALHGDGLDIAIEATGRPAVMAQALAAVRRQGGTAVVVGNAQFGETIAIDPAQFNMGKRLLGTWGGDSLPDRDFPRYCRLLTAGRLSLTSLLNDRYPLSGVNRALDALEAGRAVRPLIDMSLP